MTKKENSLVLLSSDEEYRGGRSSSSKRSYRKTKSQSPFPRKSTRQAKKARLQGSRSCLHKDSRNVDEFNLFCEDFDQVFSTFKVSAGSGGFCRNELCIDKYKPHSLEELAVHKKKIEEVKVWFEGRLRKPKNEMVKYRFIAYGGLSLADFSVVATEYVPALKWLGSSASGDHENLRVLTEENTDCNFDMMVVQNFLQL